MRSLLVVIVAAFTFSVAAPAHAGGDRASRVQSTSKSRIDSIRQGIARHVGMRPTVRNAIATQRTQVKLGLISSAATSVTQTRATIQPMGLRERFALWRSGRTVTRTAVKMADQRSAVGDTVGARDALDALETLQSPKAARAENRAFKNAMAVAKRAAGKRSLWQINRRRYSPEHGNLDLGVDNLDFAAELAAKKGQSVATNKKLLRTARTLVKGGMKMAAKAAKMGDAETAWRLLEKAAVAAGRGGLPFPEPTARKILVQALERDAQRRYKAGAHDDAAASLYQALAIQRSIDERPSRALRKLQQKLMPRIQKLVAAERAAEESADATSEEAFADASEAVASAQE